jgi:hypothetical protein
MESTEAALASCCRRKKAIAATATPRPSPSPEIKVTVECMFPIFGIVVDELSDRSILNPQSA